MLKLAMRKAASLGAALIALAACTATGGPGGPQRVVFEVRGPGFKVGGPVPVHEILDLGLAPLHNLSGSTVRLRAVRLVSPPPGVRVVNIRAYLWRQVGVGYLMSAFGDLPKQCPREYSPQPVSAVLTRPHSDSSWMVIIAIKVSRIGTYHLRKVRIDYIADGKKGWQYQNLNATVHGIRGRFPGSGC